MNRAPCHAALGRGLALLAACCGLSGCSSFRTQLGQPLPVMADGCKEGRTQVGTVVRELGPPNQASRLPDGFVFLYEYSRMSEFQAGLSVNYSILRWFKFVKAWNRLNQEALVLTFDDQGVLRGRGLGQWQESLGGGTAVQFLFVVMSLSDISEILQPADAHSWGALLLESPPVALNSGQTLRSGAHGLQLRIAPDYAGQQTLEMAQPKTEKEKRRLKKDYQWQPR